MLKCLAALLTYVRDPRERDAFVRLAEKPKIVQYLVDKVGWWAGGLCCQRGGVGGFRGGASWARWKTKFGWLKRALAIMRAWVGGL